MNTSAIRRLLGFLSIGLGIFAIVDLYNIVSKVDVSTNPYDTAELPRYVMFLSFLVFVVFLLWLTSSGMNKIKMVADENSVGLSLWASFFWGVMFVSLYLIFSTVGIAYKPVGEADILFTVFFFAYPAIDLLDIFLQKADPYHR